MKCAGFKCVCLFSVRILMTGVLKLGMFMVVLGLRHFSWQLCSYYLWFVMFLVFPKTECLTMDYWLCIYLK
jgi:hypothetical protein